MPLAIPAGFGPASRRDRRGGAWGRAGGLALLLHGAALLAIVTAVPARLPPPVPEERGMEVVFGGDAPALRAPGEVPAQPLHQPALAEAVPLAPTVAAPVMLPPPLDPVLPAPPATVAPPSVQADAVASLLPADLVPPSPPVVPPPVPALEAAPPLSVTERHPAPPPPITESRPVASSPSRPTPLARTQRPPRLVEAAPRPVPARSAPARRSADGLGAAEAGTPAGAPSAPTVGGADRMALAAAAPNPGPPLVTNPRFRRPPRPPDYPARAIELDLTGIVLVRALLDPIGDPQETRVQRSSGHPMLDAAALAAVRGWAFEPASRDGQRVAAWVEIPVRFQLR